MATIKQFFETYAPLAQKEQERSGLPASLLLAQMIQESGFNLSRLASKYNNPFGIKASKGWTGNKVLLPTTEYVNGKAVKTTANFRVYDSLEEGFSGRTEFFQRNKRYTNLLQMSDPYEMANELQRVGYATDPNYASALKSHIKKYNLTQYDSGVGFKNPDYINGSNGSPSPITNTPTTSNIQTTGGILDGVTNFLTGGIAGVVGFALFILALMLIYLLFKGGFTNGTSTASA